MSKHNRENFLLSEVPTHLLNAALWDLPVLAYFVGKTTCAVRHWVNEPPEGFPPFLRIGRKIHVRSAEVRAWALGRVAQPVVIANTDQQLPVTSGKRARGRPRKLPQEGEK